MFLFPSTRKRCEISRSRSSADEILSLPDGCNVGLSFGTWYCSSACLTYLALFCLSGSWQCHPRVTLLYLTNRFHTSLFLPPFTPLFFSHLRHTPLCTRERRRLVFRSIACFPTFLSLLPHRKLSYSIWLVVLGIPSLPKLRSIPPISIMSTVT